VYSYKQAYVAVCGFIYSGFFNVAINLRGPEDGDISRHQLRMVAAFLTGHASVMKHLHIMGLFDEDPTCRFCRVGTETVHYIICCCEALACQRYNCFGKLFAEPKDTSTASLKDLCLFISDTELMNLC
jgi:hypothetical protein